MPWRRKLRFTESGRGRIPRFGLVFKSNLLEGRTFNYNKQHLRSFKHYIPDHYVLGYHMVGHLRKRTGDADIWGQVTGRSWSFPFLPFAFSNAIKNKSGLYVTGLYRDMAASLKKEWQDEIDRLSLTKFETVQQSGAEKHLQIICIRSLRQMVQYCAMKTWNRGYRPVRVVEEWSGTKNIYTRAL